MAKNTICIWYDTDADVPGEQYKGALVAGINFSF